MSEILIQLELMTIIYLCILAFVIPVIGFCGYRIGNTIANVILFKSNQSLIRRNKKIVIKNINVMNEFMHKAKEFVILIEHINLENELKQRGNSDD